MNRLLLGFFLAACGRTATPPAPSTAPAASAAETTSPPPESAANVAGETPRRKQTRVTLEAIEGEGVDDRLAARASAEGLAEADVYKLSSSERRGLHGATEEYVDVSQCWRILAQLDFDVLAAATTKRCGDAAAFQKRLTAKTSDGDRLAEVATSCRATRPAKASALGLLTSIVVADQLAADPDTESNEQKLAAHLAQLCME